MNDASHISGNRAGVRGGGIFWDFFYGNEFTRVRCAPQPAANILNNVPNDCVLRPDD